LVHNGSVAPGLAKSFDSVAENAGVLPRLVEQLVFARLGVAIAFRQADTALVSLDRGKCSTG
jgi:hypothetical protein